MKFEVTFHFFAEHLKSVSTIIHRVSEADSGFHVKGLISVFEEFFAGIKAILVLAGDWILGYHSMEFRHFPDIS